MDPKMRFVCGKYETYFVGMWKYGCHCQQLYDWFGW